jgi:BMFP domain-containing protein YqiC
MTSADASVINDLSSDKRLSNELDEINNSLDKTITSRSELERVRSKLINYRKELNKLEDRKSLLKNKSKDTTESKREKLKQLQQEYNYFI